MFFETTGQVHSLISIPSIIPPYFRNTLISHICILESYLPPMTKAWAVLIAPGFSCSLREVPTVRATVVTLLLLARRITTDNLKRIQMIVRHALDLNLLVLDGVGL